MAWSFRCDFAYRTLQASKGCLVIGKSPYLIATSTVNHIIFLLRGDVNVIFGGRGRLAEYIKYYYCTDNREVTKFIIDRR